MKELEQAILSCSLDDGELATRRDEWRALEQRSLISSTSRPGGLTATYRGDESTALALRALVEAEKECCPTISFSVERVDDDVIRLDVEFAPAG